MRNEIESSLSSIKKLVGRGTFGGTDILLTCVSLADATRRAHRRLVTLETQDFPNPFVVVVVVVLERERKDNNNKYLRERTDGDIAQVVFSSSSWRG